MTKHKVLVTGVGGSVGQGIIMSLQDSDYDVVAVDSEELASGLHAVDKAYKGYYAVDPRYIERLLEICHDETCSLLFAGHDVELLPIADNLDAFTAIGVTPVVSSPQIIRLCDDKLETHGFLKEHGFSTPATRRLCDVPGYDGATVVLKPQRGGARSRNTYVIHSESDMAIYRELVDHENSIVQEYIEGEEYTCGTVNFAEKCKGVILLRRTLRFGETHKAFVVRDDYLESKMLDVVEALQPFGACNIQFRMKDGEPCIFEINARCSGTTAPKTLAGFNEPRMVCDYLLKSIEPTYSIREITMLRYWKDIVVENDRIEHLKTGEALLGNDTRL